MKVRLNRKLTLEAAVRVADGGGGHTQSWSALGTLWADMRPMTGRRAETGGVARARMRYRVFLRAMPQDAPSRPQPGQRFRDGARVFGIETVADAGPDGRLLICFVQEEQAP